MPQAWRHGFWDESFYIKLAVQAHFSHRTRQVISNLFLNEKYQSFYFRSIKCNIILTYLISVSKNHNNKCFSPAGESFIFYAFTEYFWIFRLHPGIWALSSQGAKQKRGNVFVECKVWCSVKIFFPVDKVRLRRSKTCSFKIKLSVSNVFDRIPEMYPLVKYLTGCGSLVHYCYQWIW